MSVADLVESILKNMHKVHPVSTLVQVRCRAASRTNPRSWCSCCWFIYKPVCRWVTAWSSSSSLRLVGHARSEGWGLPQCPLCPVQQRPDRRHPHDTEAWRGEAAGEERWDPVGCTEGAHPVKGAALSSQLHLEASPSSAWLISTYCTSCVPHGNGRMRLLSIYKYIQVFVAKPMETRF